MCACTHIFATVCNCTLHVYTIHVYMWRSENTLRSHTWGVLHFFFQLGSLVGLELAIKSRLDGSQDPGISYLSLPSTVLGWQELTTTFGFLFACIFKTSEASFTNYIYLKISYMYTIYLDHIKHSLLLSSSPWNLPKRLSLPTLCPILFITLWLRLSLLI